MPEPEIRLYELKPYYREALAYREAFQRLGYQAENILFTVVNTEEPKVIQMTLRARGREFICNVAKTYDDADAMGEGWKAATASWGLSPVDERHAIWRRSYVVRNATEFAMALVAKGFQVDPSKLTEDMLGE
jgi:hypothetical protein